MSTDPWTYANKTHSEHAEQVALFMWAGMACRYGEPAANDIKSYSIPGHVARVYGTGPENYKEFHDAIPQLKWLHAISNHGAGYGRKAEGVREGVADIFLPVGAYRGSEQNTEFVYWNGLYIELKRPDSKGKKAGEPSKPQEDFAAYCLETGYAHEFCWGWLEARDAILKYLWLV